MIAARVDVVDRTREALARQQTEVARLLLWAAARTEAIAKELVPVDTGTLKASIHVEAVSPFEVLVVAGGPAAGYAAHVEFGHALVNGGHWPGHPYLRPAFEQVAPHLRARL